MPLRIKILISALMALAFIATSQPSLAASGLVVIPKPGQSPMPKDELDKTRVGLAVRWAMYHKVKVKEPNGQVVEYIQPQPTQSRLLRAPVAEASTFALGDGLAMELRPTKWEMGAQRLSIKAAIVREADKELGIEAAKQTALLSGVLQDVSGQTVSQKGADELDSKGVSRVFIGEERFAFYDRQGDLIAEFSIGTTPEYSEITPPIAQKEMP